MATPVENNPEVFAPERDIPVEVRHRTVGPQRPSSPALQDIFKRGEELAKKEVPTQSVKPEELPIRAGTRLERAHQERLERGDFIPSVHFRKEVESLASADPMKFGMFNFDIGTARTKEGIKEIISKYVQRKLLTTDQQAGLLESLSTPETAHISIRQEAESVKENESWEMPKSVGYYLGQFFRSERAKYFRELNFEMSYAADAKSAISIAQQFLADKKITQEEFDEISQRLGVSSEPVVEHDLSDEALLGENWQEPPTPPAQQIPIEPSKQTWDRTSEQAAKQEELDRLMAAPESVSEAKDPDEIVLPKASLGEPEIEKASEVMTENATTPEERWNHIEGLMDANVALNKERALEEEKIEQPEVSQQVEIHQKVAVEKMPEIISAQPIPEAIASNESLSEEQIRERILETRKTYGAEKVLWKNENEKRKNAFVKLMDNLGVKKAAPQVEKSEEFLEAQKRYIEAQKELRLSLISQGRYSKDLISQEMEKEYAALQRTIAESLPALEKGILSKWQEKYSKLSLPARVALSTAAITAFAASVDYLGKQYNVHLPGAEAAAMAAVSGRFVRSFVGGAIAQPVGKLVDSISRKKAEKRKTEFMEEYAKSFDSDTFEQKELAAIEFQDTEEWQKKRDRLKKAGAMMATGAGVALASGAFTSSVQHADHVVHGSSAVPEVHHNIPGAPKASMQPEASPIQPSVTEAHTISHIEPISVELSSKGFIDTFGDLQHKLSLQYHDIHTAPPQIQEILSSSPEKLAIKFGFYEPTKHLSGFGLQGEHLTVDGNGNLLIEHLNGNKEIFFDAKTGAVHQYAGTHIDMQGHIVAETPISTPIAEVPHSIDSVSSSVGIDQAVANMSVPLAVGEGLMLMPIAKIIAGEAPLDQKFQAGNDKASKDARKAYNISWEKAFTQAMPGMYDYRLPIAYDGGSIQVIQKGNNLVALLNGQKIAEGTVSENGPGLTYDRNLGTSLFGSKNVYEQAYDKAKEVMNKKRETFKMVS